jgi:DNA-binding transcriptional LysR family regulator
MTRPDLNLLVTLEALLEEGNVARAARRLQLSPSAMSRNLARLRETMGDPLLVRAGRGLVPSPRAIELRERIGTLVQEAQAVLRPTAALDPARIERTFTLRAREGFVENFGAALLERLGAQAPGLRLRFLPKPDKDSASLRDGTVDLETGVVGKSTGPEVRAQALFRDRFVGVVRAGHALGEGEVTLARYVAAKHVGVARRSLVTGPVDAALQSLGQARDVVTSVGDFSAALALVRASDLVASVPERHTGHLRDGLHAFELPLPIPAFTVSLLWHPRLEADPAHRWLRGCVRDACALARDEPDAMA